MAQKFNSEFNYRTQVIGETPWARLQTLQGFLEGRKRAASLEKVGTLKLEAKKLELAHLKESNALPHVCMQLEAEIMEAEASSEDLHSAYRLNEQEIETLEKLIAELYAICNPTRIEGYTDEQMFEANAANEFTMMIAKEINAEILANGRPSPAKLLNAMSNPVTWNAVRAAGLVPENAPLLTFSGGFDSALMIETVSSASQIMLAERYE